MRGGGRVREERGVKGGVSGEEETIQVETIPLDLPEVRDNTPQIREAFRRMDRVDEESIFQRRVVMKSILRGPFRVTLRIALAEANAPENVRRARGWKVFLLLPRMLLVRSTKRWPYYSAEDQFERFRRFFELISRFEFEFRRRGNHIF